MGAARISDQAAADATRESGLFKIALSGPRAAPEMAEDEWFGHLVRQTALLMALSIIG
jgi:hypothetical protein